MAKYENANEPKNSGKWFVDSGCSNHMTYNKTLFSSYTPGNHPPVELGASNTTSVSGKGTIEFLILVNGKQVNCRLTNVLHVPKLGYQLLSVPIFDKSGLETAFYSRRCSIRKHNILLATATMKGNLYELDTPTSERALVSQAMEIWHRSLEHIQPSAIMEMVKSKNVRGLNIDHTGNNELTCTGCILGKSHRTAIPKQSNNRASKLLELVHSDVNGPIEVASLGGSRYFVTFIDDFSRWTSSYPMKAKSQTFECF